MIDLSTVKELRALRLPGMAQGGVLVEEPQRYKRSPLVSSGASRRRKKTFHAGRTPSSAGSMRPGSVKARHVWKAIEYYETVAGSRADHKACDLCVYHP